MGKGRKRKSKGPQQFPAAWTGDYRPKGKPAWSDGHKRNRAPWSDPSKPKRGGHR